jgi:hypothetical protein
MFNIVKRRDFMLGNHVLTRQEAEKLRDDYGKEYVVVQTAWHAEVGDDPLRGPPSREKFLD